MGRGGVEGERERGSSVVPVIDWLIALAQLHYRLISCNYFECL